MRSYYSFLLFLTWCLDTSTTEMYRRETLWKFSRVIRSSQFPHRLRLSSATIAAKAQNPFPRETLTTGLSKVDHS
jgi:hypothetical protein